MDCIKRVFKNTFDLKGRATRTEYWFFALFSIILLFSSVLVNIILGAIVYKGIYPYPFPSLYLITYLFLFIPSFSVSVRRMHDIGRSGWWVLFQLIPLIGPLIFFFFLILPSDKENEYGKPNPC